MVDVEIKYKWAAITESHWTSSEIDETAVTACYSGPSTAGPAT